MSIASAIETLRGRISDAYDAAEEKGATIPTDTNLANLAAAIESITSGGGEFITNKLNGAIVTTNGYHTYTGSKTISNIFLFADSYDAGWSNTTRNTGVMAIYYNCEVKEHSTYIYYTIRVPHMYYYDTPMAYCTVVNNTINFGSQDPRGYGPLGIQTVYALFYSDDGAADWDYFQIRTYDNSCFTSDTLITLADRTKKLAKDITYDDDLLVWNFDEGKFDSAKPLWIKYIQPADEYNRIEFDDGIILNTVSDHRIWNYSEEKFTFPNNEEYTKIGTMTLTENGTRPKLKSRKTIKANVESCNIITKYHMNLFANGILTSCKYNNIYPIMGMKFIKPNTMMLIPYETYSEYIDKEIYDGMRLAEFPQYLTRDKDKKYFERLKATMQPR